MSRASLANLFKTGDTITQANMTTFINEAVDEIGAVTSVDTNIPGIKANYITDGKIYNIYLSGTSTGAKTLAAGDLIVTAAQLDIFNRYQGAPILSLGVSGAAGAEQPMFAMTSGAGIAVYGIDVALAAGDALAASQMLLLAPAAE